MKIRNKLTLLFTIIFAALLLVFSFLIYLSSATTRKEQYYKRLQQQAITKTNLLLDAKVTPNVLQLMYKTYPNTFSHENVSVYDTAFHLPYQHGFQFAKLKQHPS